MTKGIKILILILLIVCTVGLLLGHFVGPYLVAKTNDPINRLRKLQATYKDPAAIGLAFDSFCIPTIDNLVLQGYFIPSQNAPKGTIIMLHGIRAYKEHFLTIAPRVQAQGYNVVLLDNRAHGESTGNYCTYGVKEKDDVSILIDSLKAWNAQGPIGLWGQSLGGAIALQSMAHDDRIAFGIVESTFTEFSVITDDYFVRFAPFVPKWYRTYLINRGAHLADFEPKDARPIAAVSQITQPVFLAHGLQDNRINHKYASELFENLASPTKELHFIEGANHVNVWQKGGSDYFDSVFEFLEKISD